jgi:hypothetical protein
MRVASLLLLACLVDVACVRVGFGVGGSPGSVDSDHDHPPVRERGMDRPGVDLVAVLDGRPDLAPALDSRLDLSRDKNAVADAKPVGPVSLWSNGFGDTVGCAYDAAKGVAVDGSGNITVVGAFSGSASFGGSSLVSAGGSDIFVASFTSSGAHRWSKRFGGTGFPSDAGLAIAIDAAGNVYVTGEMSSTMDFGGATLATVGDRDIFVASFTSSGVHRWSKSFGGTMVDQGLGISCSGGAVFVTGAFWGTVDLGGGALTSAGSYDIFLASYDAATGAHRWSKRYGNSASDAGYSVASDAAGNVYATGHFTWSADFGGGALSSSSYGIFVASLDVNGAYRWSKGFSCTSVGTGTAIAVAASGATYITGHLAPTCSFGGTALTSAGSFDIFVAGLGPTGSLLWAKRAGSAGDDQGTAVALDGKGGVYFAGYFDGAMDLGAPLAGGQDAFVSAFEASSGAHRWSKRYGGTATTRTYGAASDGTSLYVVGEFGGSVNFGNGALSSLCSDIFTLKLAP